MILASTLVSCEPHPLPSYTYGSDVSYLEAVRKKVSKGRSLRTFDDPCREEVVGCFRQRKGRGVEQ